MKTFICKETVVKKSKMYGSRTILVKIYRVKNNIPCLIGEVEYNTASTMGLMGEVNTWLTNNKHIPRKWNTRPKTSNTLYYGDRTKESQSKYQIIELW